MEKLDHVPAVEGVRSEFGQHALGHPRVNRDILWVAVGHAALLQDLLDVAGLMELCPALLAVSLELHAGHYFWVQFPLDLELLAQDCFGLRHARVIADCKEVVHM